VAVEEVTDILLAVDANGDGVKKTLWAQGFAQTGFFKQGDATRVSLRNGKLVSEGRVRVPSNFRRPARSTATLRVRACAPWPSSTSSIGCGSRSTQKTRSGPRRLSGPA